MLFIGTHSQTLPKFSGYISEQKSQQLCKPQKFKLLNLNFFAVKIKVMFRTKVKVMVMVTNTVNRPGQVKI